MRQVRSLCFAIDVGLKFYNLKYWQRFNDIGVKLEICTSKWILTMFAYDAELDLALTTIDLFIIDGWKSLVRISIAIILMF